MQLLLVRSLGMFLYLAGIVLWASPRLIAASIATVTVGNPANISDANGRGSVAYEFRISKYEVTNSQYAEFLNAKATQDPLGLYHIGMGVNSRGGITRNGVSGSFSYSVKPDMGNKPVNFVTWYDAARFTNWLHNGQGGGDTETGAYTLLGGTSTPSNGTSVVRNANASWFLPSMDEWYKAAYHQPADQGGDSDSYWMFPTRSNSDPTSATAESNGDIANPGPNVVNYFYGADWNAQNGNVTTVGSAGTLSESFYGTADQGGNVMEWTESPFLMGTNRYVHGGSWAEGTTGFQLLPSANVVVTSGATNADGGLGFRVATTTVPEPGGAVLAGIGLAGLIALFARRAQPQCFQSVSH